MNYHVDFCETGQGTAAAARSNVTPSRMETCLDQYRANKANNANGGLKRIRRGGGYYSECVKRLKGQA